MVFMEYRKLNLLRLLLGTFVFLSGIITENVINEFFLLFWIYLTAYILLGFDIVFKALKNILRGQIFDENFLMSLATIGAFAINQPAEAVVVMLFYQTGEYFQEMAVEKSKKSISDLMDIRADYANIEKNGSIIKVDPASVNIGDHILIKPGEKIPLDGIVTEGVSFIDTSALTGESVPRKANESSEVLSGCVNISGVLTVKVTKTFGESTVSKIIDLVENSASKKAKTEKFITKFARIYTPVVVVIAVFLAVLPPLFFDGIWNDWIHRALVFLVISCPCALVLSIPLGFFAGLGKAARNGILIKGGNFLEAFNSLGTVIFDKTGTITKGNFDVTSIKGANGYSESELLKLTAFAQIYSNHPIALSILREYDIKQNKEINRENLSDYTETAGCGVSVKYNGKVINAGNKKMMLNNGIEINETTDTGTNVFVSYDGTYIGHIIISDELKPDSLGIVPLLKSRGVQKTVMLTGDNHHIADSIAKQLGIDEAYGGLLPNEKVQKMEILNAQKPAGTVIAFAGDGINDAPVLAMADIGIAMGALGSDAAIEAADVVLMTDEISKLAAAIDISRFTRKIVRQNIVFTLGIKLIFLLGGAFGLASMWEAVFADVGVSLLAILNSSRILRKKVI